MCQLLVWEWSIERGIILHLIFSRTTQLTNPCRRWEKCQMAEVNQTSIYLSHLIIIHYTVIVIRQGLSFSVLAPGVPRMGGKPDPGGSGLFLDPLKGGSWPSRTDGVWVIWISGGLYVGFSFASIGSYVCSLFALPFWGAFSTALGAGVSVGAEAGVGAPVSNPEAKNIVYSCLGYNLLSLGARGGGCAGSLLSL